MARKITQVASNKRGKNGLKNRNRQMSGLSMKVPASKKKTRHTK